MNADEVTLPNVHSFVLLDWQGQVAHQVSIRASGYGEPPTVIRWRGRTFTARVGSAGCEFVEALTLTLDDSDGVFSPVKHAPTLEDVDAELQPKGLQCLTLTEPVWLGPWRKSKHSRVRTVAVPPGVACEIRVFRLSNSDTWVVQSFDLGPIVAGYIAEQPTPESAQAACEAAIVAAWKTK